MATSTGRFDQDGWDTPNGDGRTFDMLAQYEAKRAIASVDEADGEQIGQAIRNELLRLIERTPDPNETILIAIRGETINISFVKHSRTTSEGQTT